MGGLLGEFPPQPTAAFSFLRCGIVFTRLSGYGPRRTHRCRVFLTSTYSVQAILQPQAMYSACTDCRTSRKAAYGDRAPFHYLKESRLSGNFENS